MKCPRDDTVLTYRDDGKAAHNACPACGGALLDEEGVLEAVGRQRRTVGATLDAAQVEKLPEGTASCPRDGATMRIFAFREVELDICPECRSIWLDPGELEKIRRGVRRGAVAATAAGAALAAAGSASAGSGAASGIGAAVGEIAVEGAIDLAFDFVVDAAGTLVEALF